MTAYDNYYVSQKRSLPLPVWRITVGDDDHSTYYINPENGGFIFDRLDRLYSLLRQQGARVVGSPEWHKHDETITDWICKVSPSL